MQAASGDAGLTVESGATGNYTIGSSTHGSVILGSNLTISHDGTGTLVIGRPVTGAFRLTKNGTGTLTLSGVNTFTGGLTLNNGTLTLGNNAALGGVGNVFTINGGTIDVTAARTTTNNNAQNWNGDFTFAGSNTLNSGTGAVTMNANRTVTVSASTLTVGGAIGDGGSGYGLTKTGAGTLTLSGANTYAGNTAINAGILTITSNSSLPGFSTPARYSVANGATLGVYNAVTDADIVSMLDTTNFAAGASLGFDTTTASRTYTNAIANTTQGALGITKLGSNTLTLNGSLTFTGGVNVTSGTLTLNGTQNNFGGDVTIGAGSVLNLNTNNIVFSQNIINNGTIGQSANSVTMTITGVISGTGSVISQGNNRNISLNATNNSYQGITSLGGSGGPPVLTVTKLADGGLASSIGSSSSAASNLLLDKAILRYTGTGDNTDRLFTINGSADGDFMTIEANGSGALNFTNTGLIAYGTTNQTRTLTLSGTNTDSNTFAPAIANNGSGAVSLTKNDAGTWVLAGNNTYNGATTVNAGTLVFRNKATRNGNSAVTAVAAGTVGLGVGGGGVTDYTEAEVASLFDNTLSGFTLNSTSGVAIDTTAGSFTQSTSLNGTRALTKLGTNTLTLNATNTYTGATTIKAGTLSIAAITNGGVAGALGNSTNAAGNLTLGGGTLEYTGSTNGATDRDFTLTAGTTSGISVANSTVSLTISGN
ncbi:MAG: beta strand repeat-containing protein, partial [Spartobacteria bacterium]